MKKNRNTVLPLAMLVDLLFGDPPNRFHPVAWMGTLIGAFKYYAPEEDPPKQFRYGVFLSLTGGALVAGLGKLAETLSSRLPAPLGQILEAAILKTTFSLGRLNSAAREVEEALRVDDLPEARRAARYHLVSRDTNQLDSAQVAAAAIESVAENASDGVIAPLFFYTLGGLPLALFYRYVNTVDAMLGYRDAAREWLGKFPARLDDVLNFLPARLTAGLIALAGECIQGKGREALQGLHQDARKTDSPNAGFPMSAMAGSVGVKLEKVDQYILGEGQRSPQVDDIQTARRILALSAGFGLLLFFLFPGKKPHK